MRLQWVSSLGSDRCLRAPAEAEQGGGGGGATAKAPSQIELIESYFDENAEDWSDLYQKAKRVNDLVLADRKNASIAALGDRLKPGSHVLDMGCGAGLTAVDLMQMGHSVHGIDIASKMLEQARKNFEQGGFDSSRYELSCSDLFGAKLEAESFDAVAALGFLQYQTDEEDALRELNRVLKPGGTLVITGPMEKRLANWLGYSRYYYGLRRRLKRLLKPAPKPAPKPAGAAPASSEAVLYQISAHAYSYERFRRLLGEAGFQIEHCKGHGFVNFEIIGKRLGYRGELFLHRFFSAVAKVLPIGRWANDLIVVARKP